MSTLAKRGLFFPARQNYFALVWGNQTFAILILSTGGWHYNPGIIVYAL